MAPVNLIPAPRRRAQQRRRRAQAWIATVGVYAAVLAAGAVWSLLSVLDQGVGERIELEDATARLERLEEERNLKQRELTEASATLRANLMVRLEPDWSLLMALVAQALREEASLDSFRLMPIEEDNAQTGARRRPDYVLLLSGTSRSQPEVSRFVLTLEELGIFKRVKLVESRRKSYRDQEMVGFDIRCELGAVQGESP